MKTIATALVIFSALLTLGGIGFWIAAIWVIGPNSMRCGGTGMAMLLVALLAGGVGIWNLDGEL